MKRKKMNKNRRKNVQNNKPKDELRAPDALSMKQTVKPLKRGNFVRLQEKRRLLKQLVTADSNVSLVERCDTNAITENESSNTTTDNSDVEKRLDLVETVPDDAGITFTDDSSKTALPSGCAIFPVVCDTSTVLLAMQSNANGVKVYGKAKIASVRGICIVNGYKMRERDEMQYLNAPSTHPAVVLQPFQDAVTENITTKEILSLYKVDISPIEGFLHDFNVIVMLQSVEELKNLPSYPGYPDLYNIRSSDTFARTELCIGCWAVDTSRYFKQHNCYDQAIDKILQWKTSPCREKKRIYWYDYPVILTTGGKNIGKSTFNRYLINSLLNRYHCTYYLECDVGQSEFTPSGIISINRIESSKPVLGPPFTHQWKPKYMCFYGNNTPSNDPDRYVECIQFVLNNFYKDFDGPCDGPLVINTMGWIRALGLQLLMDIIRMTRPSHIIQFNTQRSSQNFAPLTQEYVASADGWVSTKLEQQKFDHIVLEIHTEIPQSVRYMAADFRNLALLSKLNQISQGCLLRDGKKGGRLLTNIQKVRPYCVSMSKVLICNSSASPIKYKHALAALNASIVWLCSVSDDVASSFEIQSDNFILPSPPVCQCIGLGLVRGVKPDSASIYIVSDITLHQLNAVNCICLGNSTLPETLLLDHVKLCGGTKTPYVTKNFPYTTVGAGMFRVHRKFSKVSQENKE